MAPRVGFAQLILGHQNYYEPLVLAYRLLGWDCVLFIRPELERRFREIGCQWLDTVEIVQFKGRGVDEYHRFVEDESRSLDLLIYDEVYGDVDSLFRFRPSCPLILSLHDVNRWLQKGSTGCISAWKNEYRRRCVVRRAYCLQVLSGEQVNYIHQKKLYSGKIFTCAAGHYEEVGTSNHPRRHTRPVTFSIPGSVHPLKRNYESVVDSVAGIRDNLGQPVRLAILGAPCSEKGHALLGRLRETASLKGVELVSYDLFIDEDEFGRRMMETDVLVGDFPDFFRSGHTLEYYGQTKVTGIFANQIRYALPAVLSATCKPNPLLASSTVTFHDSTVLRRIVERFAADPRYLDMYQEKARMNSRYFTVERIAERIRESIVESLERGIFRKFSLDVTSDKPAERRSGYRDARRSLSAGTRTAAPSSCISGEG